jgi:hypothetical protein
MLPVGFIHTIMETSEELSGDYIREVPEYDGWYCGGFYDFNAEKAMRLFIENDEQILINTETVINLKWMDRQGGMVSRNTTIQLYCGEQIEEVNVVDGIGAIAFESAEPGEYHLKAISPEGCVAFGKITVIQA